MIDFGVVENNIRHDISFGDVLYIIGKNISSLEFIESFNIKKIDLYNDKIRTLVCKRTYRERYELSFVIRNGRGKVTKTFSMDVPKIFNGGMVCLNDCIKIPLIQFVDNHIEPLSSSMVKIFNNIFEIKINHNKTKNSYNLFVSNKNLKFALLPILVVMCGGFDKFLNKYFSKIKIEIKDKYLKRGENLTDILSIDEGERIPKGYINKLGIFNFKLSMSENRMLNKIDITNLNMWKALIRINGIDFVELFDISNKIDIFSMGSSNNIFDAFEYLTSDSITSNKTEINSLLKRNRNNIDHKRIRIYEILLIPVLENIFKMILNRRGIKADSKTNIDLNRKINKEFNTLFQLYDEEYSVTSILYNFNKVTLLGYQNIDKSMVNIHRRVLHDSYYKKLCPIVTPDREKCGIILNLSAGYVPMDSSKKSTILDFIKVSK